MFRISYLSDPSLLGSLFLLVHLSAQALQGHSSVLLKSLEVQEGQVDPGDRETLNVLGDLAETALEHQSLPSDLYLLGSQVIQADHHLQQLGVLVFLEVLLNLKKTG